MARGRLTGMAPRWSLGDVPALDGRLAIVTGANSGIGLETARALANAGARVIVAARSEARGRAAAASIGRGAAFAELDVADLASVSRFADRQYADGRLIDMLVLNAGVMALPTRRTTVDGFELQFGTNYIGHFALAARLWNLMAPAGRIVSLASIAARRGRIDFDDIMAERHYGAWAVYCQSKLAMLMFACELARRSSAAGLAAIAAHPGFARTSLLANGPGTGGVRGLAMDVFGGLVSQSAEAGALPVIRAATDPTVRSGDYVGSVGPFELKGPPGPAVIPKQARDAAVAARLWDVSERLTGVSFRP